MDSVNLLHLFNKRWCHLRVGKTIKCCPIKYIADILIHKAPHHTDGNDGRKADKKQDNILMDAVVLSQVSGCQHSLVSKAAAI